MVASIASYGSLSVLATRVVLPVAHAPVAADRPRPEPAQHVISNVAFAPAAMSALIEAQEHLSHGAPELVRTRTVAKIDHLITILTDQSGGSDAPSAVRQLRTAREALALSPIDIQA